MELSIPQRQMSFFYVLDYGHLFWLMFVGDIVVKAAERTLSTQLWFIDEHALCSLRSTAREHARVPSDLTAREHARVL